MNGLDSATVQEVNVDPLVSLFARLQERDSCVKIQKLAGTTALADCNETLWQMTGHLTRESRSPHDRPRPMIRDLGYCVWRCRIGTKHHDHWFYGKSVAEAISSALKG